MRTRGPVGNGCRGPAGELRRPAFSENVCPGCWRRQALPAALNAKLVGDGAQGVAGLKRVGLAAQCHGRGVLRSGHGTAGACATGAPGPGRARSRRARLDRRALDWRALGSHRRRPPPPLRPSSRGAGRPRSPALRCLDLFGHGDLLLAAGVGRGTGAAVGSPGAGAELQAARVAVAGVRGPVSAAFTLRQ